MAERKKAKNPKIVFAKDRDSISVGDTISTSGRGGIFPPIILIGEVSSITNDEIEVKLFEHIENLTHVRVLEY